MPLTTFCHNVTMNENRNQKGCERLSKTNTFAQSINLKYNKQYYTTIMLSHN